MKAVSQYRMKGGRRRTARRNPLFAFKNCILLIFLEYFETQRGLKPNALCLGYDNCGVDSKRDVSQGLLAVGRDDPVTGKEDDARFILIPQLILSPQFSLLKYSRDDRQTPFQGLDWGILGDTDCEPPFAPGFLQ